MSQKGNEGEFHHVFSLSSELSALAIILDLLKSLFSIKRHITLQIIKYLLELFKLSIYQTGFIMVAIFLKYPSLLLPKSSAILSLKGLNSSGIVT